MKNACRVASGTGTPSPVSAWDYAQLAGDGNGAQHFNGRIDELSVYSGALSQSRITAHYNATNSFSASYVYDGNGLRQSKNVNGTATNFTWDTSSSIPQLLSDGTNRYLYGPDGQAFAQLDTSDNITWLAHDTQGNTRMLLRGDDGASIASWDYDAYGNSTIASGFADTSLKFQGQYQDTETGLLYLRARYQDPQTNQFLTVDPLSAMTQSRYGYAANDGVNYGDPSGLMCIGNRNSSGGCIGAGTLRDIGNGALSRIHNSEPGLGLQLASHLSGDSVGLCASGNAGLLIGASATGCYVQTPSGEYGFTATTGHGVSTPTIGLGLMDTVSTAQTLNDFRGPFVSTSASGGEGPFSGGVNYQNGFNSCGNPVQSFSFGWTPSLGLPAAVSDELTNTYAYGRESGH